MNITDKSPIVTDIIVSDRYSTLAVRVQSISKALLWGPQDHLGWTTWEKAWILPWASSLPELCMRKTDLVTSPLVSSTIEIVKKKKKGGEAICREDGKRHHVWHHMCKDITQMIPVKKFVSFLRWHHNTWDLLMASTEGISYKCQY